LKITQLTNLRHLFGNSNENGTTKSDEEPDTSEYTTMYDFLKNAAISFEKEKRDTN